jgi:4-amino-4-deoxy-L-arabinose transferase-like glycosyltransferase
MKTARRVAAGMGAAFALLLLTHYPLLRLPFYWDELGQFVPAALDIYHRLAWVPYTTVPNVHPPGVMAYLAVVWSLFGYSVMGTRVAMLFFSAAGLLAQWKLTCRLGGAGPASLATLFLFTCPLFFSQSMMAQLDMPAMAATAIALVLFLDRRFVLCAVVCSAAVMLKETAIVAPALFGFLLLRRGETRAALLFLWPLVPLMVWLVELKRVTGHWFGSPEFTDYNLFYPLNPVRLMLALVRRGYYLFIGSGHIIGTFALFMWLRKKRLSNEWRVVFAFVAVHVAVITVLGGAVLERYLLPALPVLYAAFAAAIWQLSRGVRKLAALALTACLLAACFINPPYPFPMENNLAWTTFVTLDQQAARYVEAAMPHATIASSFPVAGELRRPEMGYVTRPLQILEINDFRADNLTEKVRGRADALVAYSVMWDPMHTLDRPSWRNLLSRFYGYVPQAAMEEIPQLTEMRSAFRICRRGQCVEVFRK